MIEDHVAGLLKRRCSPFVVDGHVSPETPGNLCGCFLPDTVYKNYYYENIGLTETGTGSRQCGYPLCANPLSLPIQQDANCSASVLHQCVISANEAVISPDDTTTYVNNCFSPTNTGTPEVQENYANKKRQFRSKKKTDKGGIIAGVIIDCNPRCRRGRVFILLCQIEKNCSIYRIRDEIIGIRTT